jgi:RHS repeat-associated protein
MIWDKHMLIEERSNNGAPLLREFTQGIWVGGQSYFLSRDHLGSPRETVSGGLLVTRYDFDPFGHSTHTGSAGSALPFGFTGHRLFATEPLVFTLHRLYSPELARWLSRDPLKDAEFRQVGLPRFRGQVNAFGSARQS